MHINNRQQAYYIDVNCYGNIIRHGVYVRKNLALRNISAMPAAATNYYYCHCIYIRKCEAKLALVLLCYVYLLVLVCFYTSVCSALHCSTLLCSVPLVRCMTDTS